MGGAGRTPAGCICAAVFTLSVLCEVACALSAGDIVVVNVPGHDRNGNALSTSLIVRPYMQHRIGLMLSTSLILLCHLRHQVSQSSPVGMCAGILAIWNISWQR